MCLELSVPLCLEPFEQLEHPGLYEDGSNSVVQLDQCAASVTPTGSSWDVAIP